MKHALALALATLIASPLSAQQASREAFATGPVFDEFGPHAPVPDVEPIPSFSRFEIAFDVATAAEDGARNRGFESAARFMNMHVAAGVPEDRIKLVVVVHGLAAGDLVSGEGNTSEPMIRAMLDRGIRFILCGQSAAARGVNPDELIEGVEMQLSAMTAHALLQQQGYTVNPF
ncbi:hypothetical protein NAP1_10963 [Erythrobacter sp. NAP1]|uniref:DsrE family protein n=1 Tax=Erythrobacter sp. NAP1 TaxID=237727 RepID=UPI00006877FC|nr:DsrE family protein [Erythrobacter sp. NAP1]EAQ28110.1 hypothetical protein NAP1_10963 [Erythrobacter sp. NAP1]